MDGIHTYMSVVTYYPPLFSGDVVCHEDSLTLSNKFKNLMATTWECSSKNKNRLKITTTNLEIVFLFILQFSKMAYLYLEIRCFFYLCAMSKMTV